jgi:hypothetical protein
MASRLLEANISVRQYETLLARNKKIPDASVIARASEANYVLVTKDKRMETEWIDEIIRCNAKIILLTDDEGGPIHWASALICSRTRWTRALLDNHNKPVAIRIDGSGMITKVVGQQELMDRRECLLTARMARSKRHGVKMERQLVDKTA